MIPGLFHARLMTAPPVGGSVIASPAYQSVVGFLQGEASASAAAAFAIYPAGYWVSNATGAAEKSGTWFDPPTTGAGDAYEVRITPTLVSGVAGIVTNPAAAFVPLSSSRLINVMTQRFTTGTTVCGYSIKVEIRLVGGAIVSTGTFPLTVTAKVVPPPPPPPDDPGGPGPGGGGCPAGDMWLSRGLAANDASIGSMIDGVTEEAPERLVRLEVMFAMPSLQQCYRLETSNGSWCVLSESTPFTLRDGSTCNAPAMLGREVLRDDGAGGLVWDTVVGCLPVGELPVVRLNVGGHSLLAGGNPTMRIVSHNSTKT